MNNILKIIESTDNEIYTILQYPKYSIFYIDKLKDTYDGRPVYIDMFSLHADSNKRFWQYTGNEYKLEVVTDPDLINKLRDLYNLYIFDHQDIIDNSIHSSFYKKSFKDHLYLIRPILTNENDNSRRKF